MACFKRRPIKKNPKSQKNRRLNIGRGKGHKEFWWGNLKEGEHFRDQVVDGRIILKRIFKKIGGDGLD
jgi:hypothetical protein